MASAELFEDPFDPTEYVERLAWRTPGGGTKGGAQGFNPRLLYDEFVAHINELKILDARIQQKAEKLDVALEKESRLHKDRLMELQKKNQEAFGQFQALDDRINYVATKVVHLGDQLEGVNTPRAHAAEAHQLMQYFDEFLTGKLTSEVLTNQYRVREAAEIVHKLHLIAQELPYDRFSEVKGRIVSKYHQIEEELIDEFKEAHRNGEVKKMQELASTLSLFTGYQHCIDAFIDENIKNAFYNKNDIFNEILDLCTKVSKIIAEVFSSPEQVMGKLLSKIYQSKLKDQVEKKLSESRTTDPEKYLQNLYTLYSKTVELSQKLSQFKLGSDSNFITKLTNGIFKSYLDSYIDVEIKFLKDKAMMISQRFYDSKDHVKKPVAAVSSLKAVIADKSRGHITFGMSSNVPENTSGETYLSQELAINLLQETKMAFARCRVLSSSSVLSNNSVQIFNLLVEYLCDQHIGYAIELCLQGIPTAECKAEPNLYFFDVSQQTNIIFHLFEKQFSDTLLPLISSSSRYGECIQRKKQIREQMEVKLDSGIDRCLQAAIGWMKTIFKTEQKKNDYSTDKPPERQCTQACNTVCAYFSRIMDYIRKSLDGNNVEAVLAEYGKRFHRLLFEHFQLFRFSFMGGMMAICDINEYRKCAEKLCVPFVTNLFESLHSLCNLLVVAPENLRQVCTGEQLSNLDRTVLHSFIQLRSDYRSAKLDKLFAN
uniref:exocyst complex component 5-like n=1 Tax=Styela clava TaxID=7725 RepID=UPI001939AAC4|nr:exocyst complex component 5-like [Styela clava]